MTTTAQAVSAFLDEQLEPTTYHYQALIPARRTAVASNLKAAFPATSNMPFHSATLIGSAAKDTIIRPIDDVDVLALFSDGGAYNSYMYDSRKFLYRVRDAYNGSVVQTVGARGQAVRVFFQTGGHVDVVPVFQETQGTYALPAGDGSWLRTSPFVANSWFATHQTALNYNLKPLVRLLKQWNRTHSKRLKSFHLETVAASVFATLGSNQRTNMRDFFTWAPNRLSVTDPGGHSGDLSSYLTWNVRSEVQTSMRSAADRADKALNAEANGNHAEAKRLWGLVLGTNFN